MAKLLIPRRCKLNEAKSLEPYPVLPNCRIVWYIDVRYCLAAVLTTTYNSLLLVVSGREWILPVPNPSVLRPSQKQARQWQGSRAKWLDGPAFVARRAFDGRPRERVQGQVFLGQTTLVDERLLFSAWHIRRMYHDEYRYGAQSSGTRTGHENPCTGTRTLPQRYRTLRLWAARCHPNP